MKFLLFGLFFLLFAAPAWPWSGEVVSVHDGDTLKVRRADNGKTVTVRVYGVDCPELGQPWGKEARAMTARITLGKSVEVIPTQSKKATSAKWPGWCVWTPWLSFRTYWLVSA